MKDLPALVFSTYKKKLAGLPSFCRLVLLEAFEYCDHAAGTIMINSLDKFAREHFRVDPARGRQPEDITGDSIRNAFRTIKKFKSDYFQFSTVNQQIVIDMPFLRELHQSIFNEKSEAPAILATDLAADTTLSQYGDPSVFDSIDAVDLAAASMHYSINAHVKEKILTNKHPTHPEGVSFAELKQPIRRDFYPNAETIELALSHGYVNVTNPIEIKRFITYNLASSTRWADYNPVFICWLERAHENQKSTEPLSTTQPPRKNADERTPYQVSGIRKPTVADSIADNLRIIESIQRQEQQHQQQADDFINGECCETVAVPC